MRGDSLEAPLPRRTPRRARRRREGSGTSRLRSSGRSATRWPLRRKSVVAARPRERHHGHLQAGAGPAQEGGGEDQVAGVSGEFGCRGWRSK